jgi:hypothetical protein
MIFSAKLSRYLIVLSIILVASVIFPEFYSMTFSHSFSSPHVYYSPVKKIFVKTVSYKREIKRLDSKGNEYTREEFERLTPLFSYRQLLYRNEMPDSIDGIPIDISLMRLNNIFITIKPTDVYRYTIPLNPLIESEPGRPDLQMPDDFFRITDKIEFIQCYSNKVKVKLSKLFNDALVNCGFNFPAKKFFGNPSTRKPFDEGFFIVDNNNNLFHMKRVKNKPYVKKVILPEGIKIEFIKVMEMNLKEFYGIVITEDNRLFLLMYDGYKFVELPSKGFDRKKMKLVFMGNQFYRIISFFAKNSVATFVTDRNYKLIAENMEKWKTDEDFTVGKIADFIFPFKLEFTDVYNKYVNFNFTFSNSSFWIINLLFLFLLLFYFKRKRKNFTVSQSVDLIIVLLTGFYGFIAVLLIKDDD